MCDTEAAFWRAIEACPEDNLRRLVFADWLEEQGRDDEGAAIRGTVDKWPQFHEGEDGYNLDTGPGWDWYLEQTSRTYDLHHSFILRPVLMEMRGEWCPSMTVNMDDSPLWVTFHSFLAAMLDLVRAWIVVNSQKSAELPLNSRINVVSSSVSPNEYETDSSREAGN